MAIFTDDFNRANGALEAGADWTVIYNSGALINANKCYLTTTIGIIGVDPSAFNPVAGMYAQCKMSIIGSINQSIGCYLEVGGISSNRVMGYAVEFHTGGYNLVKYNEWSGGAADAPPARTILGTYGTPTVGHVVRLECTPGVQSVYIDGTLRISGTDVTFNTGSPGFAKSYAGGSNTNIDDFECGDWPLPVSGGGSPLGIGVDPAWNRNLGHP